MPTPPLGDYTTTGDVQLYIENLQTSTGLAVASLPTIITRVSRMIDSYCGRRFWTTTGDETKSFDGPRWFRDPYIPAPGISYWYGSQRFMPNLDIVSITSLKLATGTNDAANNLYSIINASDYYLEPTDRRDGWPGLWLEMSDSPIGAYSTAPFMWFNPGKNVIQIQGKFGWNSTSSTGIPDDIKEVAVMMTVREYRARASGFSDMVGIDQMGTAVISRTYPAMVTDILSKYRRINLA